MIVKTTLKIDGMNCGHCVNAVNRLVRGFKGIESVDVDLSSREAYVSFDTSKTSPALIIENINNSNSYKATEK